LPTGEQNGGRAPYEGGAPNGGVKKGRAPHEATYRGGATYDPYGGAPYRYTYRYGG
jgi:hypothetical protein